jgi:hypothetical protein
MSIVKKKKKKKNSLSISLNMVQADIYGSKSDFKLSLKFHRINMRAKKVESLMICRLVEKQITIFVSYTSKRALYTQLHEKNVAKC